MTQYYFQIGGDDFPQIAIVEKEFWDKNGYLSDQSLDDELAQALPDGFYELSESVFESDFDEEEAREKLIQAGFIEKVLFDMSGDEE